MPQKAIVNRLLASMTKQYEYVIRVGTVIADRGQAMSPIPPALEGGKR
jgi:hypothetical protein